MGSKKSEGHCADVYDLNHTKTLIQEYDTYLSQTLSLNNDQQNDTAKGNITKTTQTTQTDNLNTELLKAILEQLKELNQKIEKIDHSRLYQPESSPTT